MKPFIMSKQKLQKITTYLNNLGDFYETISNIPGTNADNRNVPRRMPFEICNFSH